MGNPVLLIVGRLDLQGKSLAIDDPVYDFVG